jgi:hypothetical protein
MKILIVCQHWPLCTGRYLTRAFTQLGIDVRHIGEAKHGLTGTSDIPQPRYDWPPQGDWNTSWADWTPDFIIYAETLHEYWRHSVYSTVPHVQINTAGAMVAPMRGIQHTFTAVPRGGIWEKTTHVTWMPTARNQDFVPSPIPWLKRTYDVTLIGRLDSERNAILDQIEAAGLKVFRGVSLYYDEYQAIYHDSRMGLVQTPNETIPCRTFEMGALGVLALTPWYPEYTELGVTGVIVYGARDPGSEIDAAKFALKHPTWAVQQIQKAVEWSKQHTWIERAKIILEWWKHEH